MTLRVVFLGTPQFAVPALDALCLAKDQIQVVGVFTQPDRPWGRGLELKAPPVKIRALELGINVFQPEKLSQPDAFERLAELQPDVIVVVAFGQILKKNVLELPRLGCINIHASLLPKWRGAAPIPWAILSGDQETGVTTMRINEKLDAGDMLLQTKTPIHANDTAQSIHDRLAGIGAALIVPTLAGLETGQLEGQKQNESAVTYAAKLTKEMEALDCQKSAQEIDRRIRALNPWPGTSVWVKTSGGAADTSERLKIKEAVLRNDIMGRAGQIFEMAGMILLGTADGALELRRMQWDGKKELDQAGFINGLRGSGKALPLEVRSNS